MLGTDKPIQTAIHGASRAFSFVAAGLLIVAMATSAAAVDTPMYTRSEDYPLPQGTSSWAAVMSQVLQNKVLAPRGSEKACLHDLLICLAVTWTHRQLHPGTKVCPSSEGTL